MGEKKQKEKTVAQWKKFVVVGACILFVVLMVVSGMGSGWISSFVAVKPGDVAVIDYTLYDVMGNPIITTDQKLYTDSAAQGRPVLFSKQISLTSNGTLTRQLYPIQVYSRSAGWANQFALFFPEYNAISAGIVGMKVNELKRINLPANDSMTQFWSAEQLAGKKVNISDINTGDIFNLGVSDNPQEIAENGSANAYLRVGEVARKTDGGVVVDFGYPMADVRIVSINARR